jgi:hypothetical protein
MLHILFRCPFSGWNVQQWLEDDTTPDNETTKYDPVRCPACGRLHFVNKSTGKLLGDERD